MPFIYKTLSSTQSELKNKVQAGMEIPHLDYVLAHEQTSGKGRHGRSWIAGPGNLYLSFWLKEISLPLTWVPHWIAVSTLKTILDLGAPADRLKVKWPNDLLVDGTAKIAGILCEKVGDGVVVGLGVNLLSTPEVSDRPVIHLQALIPQLQTKGLNLKFTEKLLQELKTEPQQAELEAAYLQASLLKAGQKLAWRDLQTGSEGSGKFKRYGSYGELVVEASGSEKSLFSEEIQLVIKP